MCVGVPALITSISGDVLPMASIDLAGRHEECCLAYLPEAGVGDHVLVQNGFAVQLLDPEAAAASLAAFVELGVLAPPAP
ncbi:MAG: HypC/HybG/HupF family hydrogenase formation chaperone [Actinobacteria bacterium]|nr:HypC/HybG/HupF family hydrogenase formation chaperone [Actinomycetota bacterium]MCG2797631.1 HypC/HybG/HupF family hydrogenase formation chaperone [Cellulomonas sp.]